MAFVAASFLASVRSTLKKKMYFEPEWDLLFFVFFATFCKVFALFAVISIFFFKNYNRFSTKLHQ